MSLHHLVHCHVCPLKDFCSSGNPDASWRVQHEGQLWKGELVQIQDKDYEKMNKASANCPLRRVVAYCDALQVQDLLRRSK